MEDLFHKSVGAMEQTKEYNYIGDNFDNENYTAEFEAYNKYGCH